MIRDITVPERGPYILERGASRAILKLEPGELAPTFPRRKFVPPLGLDEFAKNPQIWPGHWVDAPGYCQHYAYGWHSGTDLNCNHPHWDAARPDAQMAQYPLDWPGNVKDRVLRDYLDPASFLYGLVEG